MFKPSPDPARSTHAVVVRLRSVARKLGNFGHGLDAHDTLDSEIGLVRERSCEVIRAELVRGDERVRDQEAGPLVKQVEL